MIVADASTVAALLFGEPDAEEVVAALDGKSLAAPTLLRYEVANVCVRKARRYPGRRDGLLRALGLLPRLGIEEVQVPAAEAVELAEDAGLTAYDAAYLWLARRLDTELFTLDRELAAATGIVRRRALALGRPLSRRSRPPR